MKSIAYTLSLLLLGTALVHADAPSDTLAQNEEVTLMEENSVEQSHGESSGPITPHGGHGGIPHGGGTTPHGGHAEPAQPAEQ